VQILGDAFAGKGGVEIVGAGKVAAGTSRIPGVQRVSAEILEHILIVRYDPTQLTETALIAAIDKVVDAVVY